MVVHKRQENVDWLITKLSQICLQSFLHSEYTTKPASSEKNNPDKTNTCHLRMNRGTWANENKRPLHGFKAAVKGKLRLVIYSRQTCHCCHTWALTWFLLCDHGRKLKWCGCHYCRYYITEIFREGESRHADIMEKGKNRIDVQNDSGKSQDSEKDYLCKTNWT